MPHRQAPWFAGVLACGAAAAMLLAAPVQAQTANDPPQTRPAQTIPKPQPRDSKVLGGMQRGTDAAGRGMDRAGDATQRGVNKASEAASRPVRNVGEAFGRKLAPGSSGRATPPPVGPQGNAP